MSITSSEADIRTSITDLYGIARAVGGHFEKKGYQVKIEEHATESFISVTKGGMFQAIMGLRMAMNITVKPIEGGVHAKADIGVWGEKLTATILTGLIFWPLAVTQLWGLIKQIHLDDEALDAVKQAVASLEKEHPQSLLPLESVRLACPYCGKEIQSTYTYCPYCGRKQRNPQADG